LLPPKDFFRAPMLTLHVNNLPESGRRQYASQSEMRPHPDVGYQAAGTT
jgi:hypothetical protein